MPYSRYIITYFDILGFKNRVEQAKTEQEIEKIAEDLRRLRQEAKPPESRKEWFDLEDDVRFIGFSDTVIRATGLNSPANLRVPIGILWAEVLTVSRIQAESVIAGMLLRGAITVGELHFDNDALFGTGLIDAYLLESRAAIYPRIIIDPLALDLFDTEPRLRSGHQSMDEQRAELRAMLRQDMDGVWFIDYLRSFLGEIDDFHVIPYLRDHQRVIEAGLANAENKGLTSEAAKYGWLARYHNECVEELGDYLGDGTADKDTLLVRSLRGTVLHDF